jgi:hypothetical protein
MPVCSIIYLQSLSSSVDHNCFQTEQHRVRHTSYRNSDDFAGQMAGKKQASDFSRIIGLFFYSKLLLS